jgi:hypothetical protein
VPDSVLSSNAQRANPRRGEKNTCPNLARSELEIGVPVWKMINVLSGHAAAACRPG